MNTKEMERLKDDKGNMTTAVMLSKSEFDSLLRMASQKQAEKARRAIRRWELAFKQSRMKF